MDSYNKGAHLEDEPTTDLRNDDLLSIGESDVQSHAQFMIDEPIDAQLRFDLGSLDTRDLLDTQEPREDHWEFVGRGQGSEDDDTTLLEHVKQDGSSQINAKLFIDPQDTVNIIPDLFAAKVNNVTALGENEKITLSSPTSWINDKLKQQSGEKVQNDGSIHEVSSCGTMDPDIIQTPIIQKRYEGNSISHISETLEIPQSSVLRLSAQSASEKGTCVNIRMEGNANAVTDDSKETQVRKNVAEETTLEEEGVTTVGIHSSPAHTGKEPQAVETSIEHLIQTNTLNGDDVVCDSPLTCSTPQKLMALKAHNTLGLAEESTLASSVANSISHGKDEKLGNEQNASLGSNFGIVHYIRTDSEKDMAQNRETNNGGNDGTEDSSFSLQVTIGIEKEAPELIADSSDKHNAMSSHSVLDCGQEMVMIDNRALEIQGQVPMADIDKNIADQTNMNDMSLSISHRTAFNETNNFIESTSNNVTTSANIKDVLVVVETSQHSLHDDGTKEESGSKDSHSKSFLPELLEHMAVGGGSSENTAHVSEGMPKKPTNPDVCEQQGSQHDDKSGDTTISCGMQKEFISDSKEHPEAVNVSHGVNDITKNESLPHESGRHQEDHHQIKEDKNQSVGNMVRNGANDATLIKALANDQMLSPETQNTVKPNDNILKRSDISKGVTLELPITHSLASTAITESPSCKFVSTTAPDVIHSQVTGSKRKVNKLMNVTQSSPVQVGSDEAPKSTGKGEFGGYKGSPSRSGASSQKRRKGITCSVLQASNSASLGTPGFQVPPNVKKSMLSTSSSKQKTHSLPDLNVGEAVISAHRFTEQQQVQLRAQILVYGSLIQGGVPEEALMDTAFSRISGVLQRGGNDLEGSGRAAWENTWRTAVERIHPKSSDSTLKNAPGILTFSARATDTTKITNNPGASVTMMEGSNAVILNSKPQENWGRSTSKSSKSIALPNFSTSMGAHSISSSVGETYVKPSKSSKGSQSTAFLNPSTSMATHSMSPPLGDPYLNRSSNPHADLHQNTSRTYFSTPSVPYPAGPSQWIPPFPGPWVAQTQSTVHNPHSVLPRHSVSPLSSSQTLDNSLSRNTSSLSSLSVSVGPMLNTPVIGSFSVSDTDTVQKKHITTESRPRKRKKTASEHPESPLNVVGNTCLSFSAAPPVFQSVISTFDRQTQEFGHVSLVTNNSFSASGPLAMVTAEKHIPNTSSEKSLVTVPGDKVLDASTHHPVPPTSTSQIQLGKSLNVQDLKTHLEEAKATAEEASSFAESSVLESTSLWSQLKAQKGLELSSDMEIQFVSSVLAAETAVAVAKAAAAAARAACEAARQARMIGENALSSNHQEYSVQPRHGQDCMDNSVSLPWKMTENCNSIIALAKNASKKRLESTSVAGLKAENLDLVVRAAELAINAVSQVGTVMALGESVPFTLENLMEVGPEGIEMFLSLGHSHRKETVKEASRGGCDGKKIAIKEMVSPGKECISYKANQSRLESTLTQKELEETAALVRTDQPHNDTTALVRIDQSHNDTVAQVSVAGGVKPADANIGIQIVEGSLVEVLSDEEDLRGIWFSARVQKVEDQQVLVVYELLSEDGTKPLEEWLKLEDSIDNVPRVRLAHPNTSIGFEGTRKRRREAMGSYKWSVGDHVDAFIRDGWREGEIREIVEDGDTKVKVFFTGEGDTSLIKISMIRPSLLWRNGQWVMWADTKQASNVVLGGTHKKDTPSAKRRKFEKSQVETGNISKQMVEPRSLERYKGGNHLETATGIIDKTSTQDGVNISDHLGTVPTSNKPGAKVALGVPKVAKKRKFMEVSKHYVSSKGSHILDVKGEKSLAIIQPQFHMGSGEVSKPVSVKARKMLSSGQDDGQHNEHKNAVKKAQTKGSITRSSAESKSKRKEELPSRLKDQDERQQGSGKQAESFAKESTESEKQASTKGTMETSTIFEYEFSAKSTQANEKSTSLQGKRSNTISVNRIDMKRERKKRTYKENDRQLRNYVLKNETDRCINKENEKAHSKMVKGHKSKVVGKKLELKDDNHKDIGSENSELRRTSRKIQPTSKLLEGLQTAPSQSKSSSSQERGSKKG